MTNPEIEEKTYELVNKLLEEYHTTLNESKREKIKALVVTHMLPVVKRIARRIARRSYDPIDDLTQAGAIGLLKAIENYSKLRCENFKFYAGYLIIGEMKHYLRDKMSTIRVPRYIQELSLRINSFIKSLTVEELNELTDDDVAEALNISSDIVDYARQAERRKNPVFFDDIYKQSSDSLGFEELVPAENVEEKSELHETESIIKNVMEELPEEYKKIVKMYYFDGYSQKEIAEKGKYTQMQVCRYIKKALSMMHDIITENNLVDYPTKESGN